MRLRQIAFWTCFAISRIALAPLFRVAFRVRLRGRGRVPRAGGLLVVSNHISFVDPPFLGTFLPRAAYWMAMVELFRHPIWGPLARILRCIPVDRQAGDSRAVREAVRKLRAGECVIIFPEGGIRAGERSALHGSGVFKEGAAAIARIAQVPILPVVLGGTRAAYDWRNWFFRRPPMTIEFGEPFHLDKHATRKEATETLRARMIQLARQNTPPLVISQQSFRQSP